MILKIGVLAILAIIILPAVQVVAAEEPVDNSYTVLAPLPGTTVNCTSEIGESGICKTTLQQYLPGVFNLLIALSAVFAVLMIVVGGFQYMSSDAIMKKEEGKKRITNAIYGLILVIGAYIILYTINPKLLELDLNIGAVSTTPQMGAEGTLAGFPMTPAQIEASNAERALLETMGVQTYRGPCTEGQITNCVNLNGLTQTTSDGLALLASNCGGCSILITAGTEAGHSATGGHPDGRAVDLRPNPSLNTYLGYPNPVEGSRVTKTYIVEGGQTVVATFVYEITGGNAANTSTGDHWHVSTQAGSSGNW